MDKAASRIRLLLECNEALIVLQNDYSCNAIVVLLKSKGAFLWGETLHTITVLLLNCLCIRNISLHAQNSRISHQRFLCAFSSQF